LGAVVAIADSGPIMPCPAQTSSHQTDSTVTQWGELAGLIRWECCAQTETSSHWTCRTHGRPYEQLISMRFMQLTGTMAPILRFAQS
jgi:hypothetical protein